MWCVGSVEIQIKILKKIGVLPMIWKVKSFVSSVGPSSSSVREHVDEPTLETLDFAFYIGNTPFYFFNIPIGRNRGEKPQLNRATKYAQSSESIKKIYLAQT